MTGLHAVFISCPLQVYCRWMGPLWQAFFGGVEYFQSSEQINALPGQPDTMHVGFKVVAQRQERFIS